MPVNPFSDPNFGLDAPVSKVNPFSDPNFGLPADEPTLGLGATMKEIGKQIIDVPEHLAGAAAATYQGTDIPGGEEADSSISEGLIQHSRNLAARRAAEMPKGKTAIPGVDTTDIQGLGPSLGFSGVGVAAGLGAGVPSSLAGPVAGYVAGGTASGLAAKRMSENQFLHDLKAKADQEAGHILTTEEFSPIKAKYEAETAAYGTGEAVPEALGNVIDFAILRGKGGGFGKTMVTRAFKKLAAMYGTEVATETVTQQIQQRQESIAGLTPEQQRSYADLSDWWASLKEVAAPTILQTTLMAGAGGAVSRGYDKLKASAIPPAETPPGAAPSDLPADTGDIDASVLLGTTDAPGGGGAQIHEQAAAARAAGKPLTAAAIVSRGLTPQNASILPMAQPADFSHHNMIPLSNGGNNGTNYIPFSSAYDRAITEAFSGAQQNNTLPGAGVNSEPKNTKPGDITRSNTGRAATIEGGGGQDLLAEDGRVEGGSRQSQRITGVTLPENAGIAGHPTKIILPDNTSLSAQFEVVDADQITASLKEGKGQPRDRSGRLVSAVQISNIVNNLNYDLVSADTKEMGVGPTTIAEDGTIVGGNGRFEAISQAYDQGKAADYRARLEADAITKGIDPTTFAGMKKPVLVRRITQPFDTRSLAVASNSGGSLQYSALELAKIDGERMATLGDIEVNDTGDIEMTVANMQNVRRALAGYGAAELGSMSDKDGMLSQEGIRRIKNAMLYKAYGNSPTLSRLVETTDNEMRSVSGALVRAAGAVASVRADMADGAIPSKTDIAADLVVAVELLIKIKSSGGSVEQYLAQHGLFKGEYTEAAATILRFLSENIRSQKKMADFIRAYYDAIASEDTKTGSMFEELAPATKQERLNHAKQQTEAGQAETAGRPTGIADAQDQQQPESAKGAAAGGGEGQQAAVTGDGTQAAPILTSPTKEEITQREHEADQRKADEDAQAKKEQADKDAADVAARTKSRTDNADNFQFGESSKDAAKPMGGLFDQSNQEAKTEPFDSEAWNKKRDDTIKASKQSGNVHLDQVPVAVETMRGKEITYAHDLKEKGVIRTVDNRGSVLVYWSDKYSADKEMANEKKEKKKTVFESWLGPTDLKDYVFTDPQDLRRYAKTEPASNDAAKADADIEAALFDLGAIMRDVAGVQRLLPEDRPKVMAVLVRLFDAAFRKGYYDIKDAAKYVRKLLSENESVKALLNHITTGMMNEAAQQAADNMPAGFFDNQGLFAQAAPETKAEASPAETKSNVITISDIPKSLKIQLESMVDGRTKRKLVSARKAMFAANQRVEKLEVLRKCL